LRFHAIKDVEKAIRIAMNSAFIGNFEKILVFFPETEFMAHFLQYDYCEESV